MTDDLRIDLGGEAEDRRARHLAITEFRRPLLVTAGAGSGKTSTLVARVLAWAIGPGWAKHVARAPLPEAGAEELFRRIVAVTFTDRAAGEMRERLLKELARLANGEPVTGLEIATLRIAPDEVRRRAGTLSLAASQFSASTIHAWCRALLARFPLEAGISPAFVVDADGLELRSLIDRTVARAAATALADPPSEDWITLFGAGFHEGDIAQALERLILAPVSVAELQRERFSPAVARDWVNAVLPLVLACAQRFSKVVGKVRSNDRALKLLPELTALASELATAETCDQLAQICARPVALLASPKFEKLSATAQAALGEDDPIAAQRDFDRVLARVKESASLDPQPFQAAQRVLAPLLASVEAARVRQGILTFADLLQVAQSLLETNAAVRQTVRGEIDQLLVDEFQDTDPRQYAIVASLSLGDGPAPGLFLVGDPKQSIYGWRQADLLALDDFADRLIAAGGQRLELSVNFRSVPGILDEVGRVLRPIMREERGLQPPFVPLIVSEVGLARARRPAVVGPAVRYGVAWELEDPPILAKTPARVSRQIEAKAVAQAILEAQAQGVAFGDQAILFRSTSAQEHYAQELRRAGVPFTIDERTSFFARREIKDLAALLRCILDPTDMIALVATLRSPMVGVPDAALEPLWRGGFARLLAEAESPRFLREGELRDLVRGAEIEARGPLSTGPTPPFADSLIQAVQDLCLLRERIKTDPAPTWIAEIESRFQPREIAYSRSLGEHRAVLVDAFFRQLLGKFDRGVTTPELLDWLNGVESDSALRREPAVTTMSEDAVPMLTIHKAKGLDWRIVYLVDLGHAMNRNVLGDHEVLRTRSGACELRLFGFDGGFLSEERERARARARAEEVRTLYVAMTRAKDHLVLLGRDPKHETAVDQVPALWELLSEREESWPAWSDRFQSEEISWLDDHGVEFGFARRWLAEASPLPDAPRSSVALDGLIESTAALEAGRHTRLERMQTPRFMAASSSKIAAADSVMREDLVADDLLVVSRRLSATGESGEHLPREVARAVGTAVHAALETWNPADSPASALATARQQADLVLRSLLAPVHLDAARPECHRCLGAFFSSESSSRIRSGQLRILARELPFLLTPSSTDPALQGIRGSIDLLLEESSSGNLIVVDYKTDRDPAPTVHSPESLAPFAATPPSPHAAQPSLYLRAIRAAYSTRPLHFELWHL